MSIAVVVRCNLAKNAAKGENGLVKIFLRVGAIHAVHTNEKK